LKNTLDLDDDFKGLVLIKKARKANIANVFGEVQGIWVQVKRVALNFLIEINQKKPAQIYTKAAP